MRRGTGRKGAGEDPKRVYEWEQKVSEIPGRRGIEKTSAGCDAAQVGGGFTA